MLPASIVILVLLYTFMYNPNRSEKYCGACGLSNITI